MMPIIGLFKKGIMVKISPDIIIFAALLAEPANLLIILLPKKISEFFSKKNIIERVVS